MAATRAPSGAVPLAAARLGDSMIVTEQVQATPAVRRRLAELGVRVGSPVALCHRTSGGGAILAVGDARLAVSRDILAAVRCRPAEPVSS